MPRHLVYLCHSFYGIEASNIAIAIFSNLLPYLGVSLEGADANQQVETVSSLDGTVIKHCVDGEQGGQQLLLHDGQDGERGERTGLT